MLRIFFCASAAVGVTRPAAPSAATSTRTTNKQSRIGRAMDFSFSGERTTGMRDACPGKIPKVFEDHHESDSSIATSIESVRDGRWGPRVALPREWPLRYTSVAACQGGPLTAV